MKCLETERLIEYAYGLASESRAAELRAHLEECSPCRAIVEQHRRLGIVLDEWKTAQPTPGFDARVRQAIDAQKIHGQSSWAWEWARSLALASLGVLIVAGVAWFARHHHGRAHLPQVSAQAARPSGKAQIPAKLATPEGLSQAAAVVKKPSLKNGPGAEPAGMTLNDDRFARAMEDYDLAANFDLLSEIPKGDNRVAN